MHLTEASQLVNYRLQPMQRQMTASDNFEEILDEESEVEPWNVQAVIDADFDAALTLDAFTKELITFLLKVLDEDPEARQKLNNLCDYELYENFVTLEHFEHAIRAVGINPPNGPLYGELVRLRRRVRFSYLDQEEYRLYRAGHIAAELRKALDYPLDTEMFDEWVREKCLTNLEERIGEIKHTKKF